MGAGGPGPWWQPRGLMSRLGGEDPRGQPPGPDGGPGDGRPGHPPGLVYAGTG